MIKRYLVWALLILSACNLKTDLAPSVAQQRKHIDSLLQIQIKELEEERAAMLQDRLSIELKLRIDSITKVLLQSRAMQNDSVHRMVDSAIVPSADTLKHP
jgi:hypothetical protein